MLSSLCAQLISDKSEGVPQSRLQYLGILFHLLLQIMTDLTCLLHLVSSSAYPIMYVPLQFYSYFIVLSSISFQSQYEEHLRESNKNVQLSKYSVSTVSCSQRQIQPSTFHQDGNECFCDHMVAPLLWHNLTCGSFRVPEVPQSSPVCDQQ